MSMLKNLAKALAAQTVVGVCVNAVEKHVVEPVKDQVKKVWSKSREKRDDDRSDRNR